MIDLVVRRSFWRLSAILFDVFSAPSAPHIDDDKTEAIPPTLFIGRVAAIATAHAKAQVELSNPEKTAIG